MEDYPSEVPAPYNDYAEKAVAQTLQGHYMHRPRLQRLKDAKKALESKLADVNKAIDLLEKNPTLYEVMEAVEKASI